MTKSIRVLLADDHPLIRTGIRAILNAASDVALVAEATNSHEAQHMSVILQPDVLLLDLRMPGPPPTEVIPSVRQLCPGTAIVILTGYDDEVYVRRMLNLGIAGYVPKEEATETIVSAIRTVVRGDAWLSEQVQVLEQVPLCKPIQAASSQSLTARERQILDLLMRGWDNARIARALNLAEQTVRNHLSRIYVKLDVRSRAEAIVWAREQAVLLR